MRIIIIVLLLFAFTSAHSQTIINTLPVKGPTADSIPRHKWFLSSYAGIGTGITFYRGGSSSFLIAPFSVQLNRALSNNVLAFGRVTAAPLFTGINYLTPSINKTSGFTPYRKFGSYSSASLGLQYTNDAGTFSISGSVGIERSSNPYLPFYPGIYPQATIAPGAK